ncbi:MAG: hypothetical protein ACJA04_000635 [Cellvibrionaceae bacterium]|jgi:hypothetical protein
MAHTRCHTFLVRLHEIIRIAEKLKKSEKNQEISSLWMRPEQTLRSIKITKTVDGVVRSDLFNGENKIFTRKIKTTLTKHYSGKTA